MFGIPCPVSLSLLTVSLGDNLFQCYGVHLTDTPGTGFPMR